MRPFPSISQGLRALQSALPRSTTTTTTATSSISRKSSSLTTPSSRPFSQLISSRPPSYKSIIRQYLPLTTLRNNSSSSNPDNDSPSPLTDRSPNATTDAEHAEQNRIRRENEPAYQITFTCKPCDTRSSHRISKHGYHRGTILIKCPSCANRHVIADNLNIFFDKKQNLEDILNEQGAKLKRGYLDGDMEFWDDGSVTPKEKGDGDAAAAGAKGGEDQGKLA
ncbi:zf-DNL-domain-containing protein [Aspergillus ellipticus CBS 707.79]|uniref:Zf-DNL-domain-containing protein n=1 Tax=Aspergillus ellipticus CBS 707.79 TaxID=1448320 RepID=A0A319CYN2_9EURO|nr:zf-DNL-domain-containing protein [Aspergillus ellipticus CBS 707.79]